MVNEEKIIFFTGAPGSKWSAVAYLLSQSPFFSVNISDYSPHRTYTHSFPKVSHLGAYWGPGFEFGNKFHKLNELSKDEIISEIEKPYTDNNWEQYRLIKCHQFSLHLDFIKETFPKSKIIIVLRPDELCVKSWAAAGGFDGIAYPNYTPYYKNISTLEGKVVQENDSSKNFIHNHELDLTIATKKYWQTQWGVKPSTSKITQYIKSVEGWQNIKKSGLSYDVAIARYNFKELTF
jgi:hypothetical protein